MSNPLVVNPTTGFLESPSPVDISPERNYFNSDRKLQFLALMDEAIKERRWPTVNDICDVLRINIRTLTTHLSIDKAFALEWQERKERLQALYTAKLAEKADHKMGTLANLAMLRWLESGTWNPETRVNHVSDNAGAKSLANSLYQVVDAEIVDNSTEITSAPPSQGDAHK